MWATRELIDRQQVLDLILEAVERNFADANHNYIQGYQEAYKIVKDAPTAYRMTDPEATT